MHFRHYRSSFESMVFETTGVLHGPSEVSTAGGVYGWIQRLHPSAVSGDNPIEILADGVSNIQRGVPIPEKTALIRAEPVYRRKFVMEHLFEVVVMYLFNGLKSTMNVPESGSNTDTTALLHYLVYMIPEADKLHVVDMDANKHYFERMENVRVIFDHTDFRFRVIIKQGAGTAGWIDISLQLRMHFADMVKKMAPVGNIEIDEHWVEIVNKFRTHLVSSLSSHTGKSLEVVDNWVLQSRDIQWETSNYATGHVKDQDLIGQTNTDNVNRVKPFIISYWADNYLEFNGYKLARMFNGLVGYGEYLYSRDNNFCRKATNNFFVINGAEKKWLWEDLPVGLEKDAVRSRASTMRQTNGVEEDRGKVLESFIKDGKLHLTDDFRDMVDRRHVDAWDTIVTKGITVVTKRILQGATMARAYKEYDFRIVSEALRRYLEYQLADIFPVRNVPVHNIPDDEFPVEGLVADHAINMSYGDGVLEPEVLGNIYHQFMIECFRVAKLRGIADFYMGVTIVKSIRDQVSRLIKSGVHLEREKWLLREHTSVVTEEYLIHMREMYKTTFWNNPSENVMPVRKTPPTATATFGSTNNVAWEGLGDIAVSNNSSNNDTYMDPVINTHAVGYAKWARFNNVPCNVFALGYSADMLQKYYDRKVNYNGLPNFVSSCDLTSLLRTTQDLVRGFDKFIVSVSNSRASPTNRDNFTIPMLQTTRSPYEKHGLPYPLDGGWGVYGAVVNKDCGKRRLHCDDLLVFGNVLFTVVNSPGIFNLLNSAAGDVAVAARNLNMQGNFSNTTRPVPYLPMPANIGFVNSGKQIQDGNIDTTSHDNNSTWIGISKMTYTKLRVGIMDQADTKHSSRWYLDEVLNNTRPTTSETALHAWSSFMSRIYKKQGFADLFRGYTARRKKQHEQYPDMPEDVAHLSIQDQIEKDSLRLVQHLHTCCKDAGLQTTDPTADNYAFSSLYKMKIKMPQNLSHQIFYILFGETICKLADDLVAMKMRTENPAQNLQMRSNYLLAKHLRDQIPDFLIRITKMFFNGDLHRSLVSQLRRNRHKNTTPVVTTQEDLTGTKDFELIVRNVEHVTHNMRNKQAGEYLKDTPWHRRSVSAEVTKQNIVRMFTENYVGGIAAENDTPGSPITSEPSSPTPSSPVSSINAPTSSVPNDSSSFGTGEESTESDMIPEEDSNMSKSKATFHPYVQMYTRVDSYFTKGVEYRNSHEKDEIWDNVDLFYENRMLAMRICEEQMHLIERHQGYLKDYPGSVSWQLLFDMFLYQRQRFAELRMPVHLKKQLLQKSEAATRNFYHDPTGFTEVQRKSKH